MEFSFLNTKIIDLVIIKPNISKDLRGTFSRTFCINEFKNKIKFKKIKQINYSTSTKKGTLRGMHYQINPFKEGKIVRCMNGEIFDVIVDLRKNSKSFLQKEYFRLNNKNNYQLYIPRGCAHGFQTLSKDVEILYLHDELFDKKSSSGINYSDPMLDIKWPLPISNISLKDKKNKYLDKSFIGI